MIDVSSYELGLSMFFALVLQMCLTPILKEIGCWPYNKGKQ